jgi:16S rRNA processing protein RimM
MLLSVARIGRAHGVRGEVTVELLTDQPELRFSPGNHLETDEFGTLTVEKMHNHGGITLIKFREVSDRNGAEKLRNQILRTEVDISLHDSDEFHVQELLDAQVRAESGELLGTVANLEEISGQSLMTVAQEDGNKFLIPFRKEFVVTVDVPGKKIIVKNWEGLLS